MNKIEKIMNQFFDYTDGVRIIFLIQRTADGGTSNLRKQYKKVSRNREEFEKILTEFIAIKDKAPVKYRIYSSVNSRNTNKAIKVFKTNQLEADYYCEKDRDSFYFDVKNRFVSALMRGQCKNESSFLIDVDSKDKDIVRKAKEDIFKIVGRNFFRYETKNGYHFITPPFNPQFYTDWEIKKDSLLLLDY